MIRTILQTDNEKEIERLMNNLAPYLRNKVRPFLFMVGEKEKLRNETKTTIRVMLTESKASSSSIPRALEVFVSDDTMPIAQKNVSINI